MTKDEIENKRLLKAYGITLKERQAREVKQAGRCAICCATMKTRKLNVDHAHDIARTKIMVRKIGPTIWAAQASYTTHHSFYSTAVTRRVARELVHKHLLHASVRGLLCWRCNKGLKFFADSPGRLRVAARYLSDYYENLWEGDPTCQPSLTPQPGPLLPQLPACTPT